MNEKEVNHGQKKENEKWGNIEDVAAHLSVTPDTVRTWVRSGKLPSNKVGKRYKFRLSEIDKLVLDGKL